jgi:uncharacterized DUF497 family protein
MGFEWDLSKAGTNLLKHGILFADVVSVFEDEMALTTRDSFSENEERWISIGMDLFGRLFVVVYAWRGDAIRLISARHATPAERQQYESGDS